MSNQSSKNLSVTTGDEVTRGEKQLEAGSEKQIGRENKSEVETLMKKQDEKKTRLEVSSPKPIDRGVMNPKTDQENENVIEMSGLETTKGKPKRCRGKLQARNAEKSIKHKDGPKIMKRPSEGIIWDSPLTKKRKMGSPNQEETLSSPKAKGELELEIQSNKGNEGGAIEGMMVSQCLRKNQWRWLVTSPAKNNEDHQLERSGFGE